MCHLSGSKANAGCSCHGRPAPATASAPVSGGLPLAMVTVPIQAWEQPYEACKALTCGTVFPCLNLPFYKTGGDCCG